MRRIFAFIATVIALLVAALVGIPTISSTLKNGTEFDGGYTILYKVTDRDGNEYKGSALDAAIERATKIVNNRLDTLTVSNPEVAVVNDTYINVTIPDMDDYQLAVVRHALANNGKVSFRDTSDNDLLPDGYTIDEVIESVNIQVSNGTSYLVVKLKDADVFDQMTETIASTYDEDSSSPNMVIWLGFEETYTDDLKASTGFEGDHYSDYSSNEYAAFKILSAVAVDSCISEDFTIQSTVETSNVNLFNKILDEDKYAYVLTEEYTSKVGSYRNENIPNLAIIAGIIGLIAIIAALVVIYHLSGAVAGLSIAVSSILTIALYNAFGGLFGAETIIAMIVGIVLAVAANVIFLEKIKAEIKKGKKIDRAYEEGSRKSTSAVLDSNILALLTALSLYLFGNQVIKSFSAVMIINQVVIIVIVVLITRLMLSLVCKSSVVNNTRRWFNVKDDEIKNINEEVVVEENKVEKINFTKGKKTKFVISGVIVLAGVVVALVASLFGGSIYNYNASLKSGSKVYFRTVNSDYSTVELVKENIAQYVVNEKEPSKVIVTTDTLEMDTTVLNQNADLLAEYNLDVDTIKGGRVTLYCVEIFYVGGLDKTSVEQLDAVFEKEEAMFYYDEDYEYESNSVKEEHEDIKLFKTNYTCGSYEPTSGNRAFLNGLFALAMAFIFAGVYMLIRFGASYALTALITICHNELVLFGALAIVRINIGTEVIALGLALLVLTLNSLSVTFDKLRENVSESSDVIWTKDVRLAFIEKAIKQTIVGHSFAYLSGLLLSCLVLGCVLTQYAGIPVSIIIAIVAAVYGSFFIAPYFWAGLDSTFAKAKENRKARRALKAKPVEDTKEPKEYVFFGIND